MGITATLSKSVAQVVSIASLQLMQKIPPESELNAFRFGLGVVLGLVYSLSKPTLPTIAKENIKWLIIIIATTIGFNFSVYNFYLKRMPIVTVLCTLQSFKIILTLIFAKIFLNSSMTVSKLVICLVTFAGTVLTVVPRLEMYLDSNPHEVQQVSNNGIMVNMTGDVFPYDVNNITSVLAYDVANVTADISRSTIDVINVTSDNVTLTLPNETCVSSEIREGGENNLTSMLIALSLIFVASMASVVELVVFAGTSVKEENLIMFSFWYYSGGAILSIIGTFAFEQPFIPETTGDKLLCLTHSVSVTAVVYLEFVAFQNLDANVYVIVSSIRLPLALILQMTVLKGVVAVRDLYMLIIGMVITAMATVVMAIYEYWVLQRQEKKEKNNDAE